MKNTNKILLTLAAMLLTASFLSSAAAAEKRSLMWGATNQSSGAFPMNVGMAEVINKQIPEVLITVIETGATNDNFRRMERGEVSFGQASTTDCYTANHGLGIWEGKTLHKPRVLVSANPQAFLFTATEESGIKKLSDLDGKPYSPGLKGSTTELLSYAVFATFGIKPKMYPGGTGEAVDGMKDRRILGFTKNSTLTNADSALQDVATTRNIRLIPFSAEEQKKFLEKYPYYPFVTMPASVYKQEADIVSIGTDFGIAVDKDLDADLVYKITKAICENGEIIGQTYPGVRNINLAELTARSSAWLHSGTIRYLKEKGYTLDAKTQYPPEYKE